MMKFYFLIVLLAYQVGGYFFVGQDNAYSVLLPKTMKLVQIDTLLGGEITNSFYGTSLEDKIEFTLSFSIVEGKNGSLESQTVLDDYEEKCHCDVLEVERISFNHFTGVKYHISRKKDGFHFRGYVYISEGVNGKSINIVSIGLEKDSEILEKVVEPIMNTVVLNY